MEYVLATLHRWLPNELVRHPSKLMVGGFQNRWWQISKSRYISP